MELVDEQYKKMTETPVTKLILMLGIPTIISMLVTNIYNMADTYFVGTLGTSASGATGIVFGLMSVLQAFGFMFGHGAGSNISRKLGGHDIESARVYASTSFFGSIFAGLVIMIIGLVFMNPVMYLFGSTSTILPYARTYAFYILIAGPALTSSCVMNNILRYEGKAFYAMLGLTSGGILNMFMDALFVRKLNMGIAGAGLATAVSQYISWGILLLPYFQGKTQSQFHFKYITKDIHVFNSIVSVGSPSLARQGLNSISTMVLNSCAGVYGDSAIAAISIVNRICNFLFCVATGIGQGFQPVSAFNYGAGIYSRVKKGFKATFIMGLIVMIALGVFGYTNATVLVRIFRDDIEVIQIGEKALRYQCLGLWLMPLTLYGNMLFQSIGKAKTALFLACLRSGFVLIPVLFITTHFFGIFGLEIAQAISEVLSSLITIPFIVIFLKNLPLDAK